MPGDIEIGIELKLVGETDRTIAKLNDLTRTFENLRNFSLLTSESQEQLGKGMIRIGDSAIKVHKLLTAWSDAAESAGIDFDQLSESTKKVNTILRALNAQSKLASAYLITVGNSATVLGSQLQPSEEDMKKFNDQLIDLRDKGLLTQRAFDQMSRGFAEAGMKIPSDVLRALFEADPSNFIQNVRQLGPLLTSTSTTYREYADAIRQGVPAFKEALEYHMQLENAIQRLSERARSLDYLSKLGTSIVSSVKPSEEEIRLFNDQLNKLKESGIDTNLVFEELSRGFARAGPRIPADLLKGIYETTGPERFTDAVKEIQNAMRSTSAESLMYAGAIKEGIPALVQSIQKHKEAEIELTKYRLATQMAMGSIGALGMTLMDFSRTLFWIGLGSMFAMMSLSRLSKSYLQVESAQMQVIRAQVSLEDAQERLQKYYDAGITSGKGFRNAQLEVMEATLATKLAEDRLSQSIEQNWYNWLMLVFGTFPTVIRGFVDLFSVSARVAQVLELQGNMSLIAGIKNLISGQLTEQGSIGFEIFNAAAIKTFVLLSAITFGLTLLIAVVSYFISKWQIESMIEDTNKQLEKLGYNLNKRRHSPTLVESFKNLAKDSKDASESVMKLAKANDMISASGIPGTTVKSISINFSGPVNVRSESDMSRISEYIVRAIRTRGALT